METRVRIMRMVCKTHIAQPFECIAMLITQIVVIHIPPFMGTLIKDMSAHFDLYLIKSIND